MTKGWSNKLCDDTGIETDEVEASLIENFFREKRKLQKRETYGGKKLPDSLDECKKPPTKTGQQPNACADADTAQAKSYSPCGGTEGDPHLLTIDQRYYDFQAVGEFVAVRSKPGDLEVQTRQSRLAPSKRVSANTAVALKVGPDRVGFYLVDRAIQVHLAGTVVQLPEGDRALPGGGTLTNRSGGYYGGSYTVRWPDGSRVLVDNTGGWALRVLVSVNTDRQGTLTGLLGNFDGNPANDPSSKDGTVLPMQPTYEQLYRGFGDSWRITPAESLFDYASGQGTDTYTDRSFPDASAGPDIPDRARDVCAFAGVSTPERLEACALDLGVTGQPAFAVGAADTQAAVGTAVPGEISTLDVTTNGQPAVHTFDGSAGQKVFVEVLSATVPDACGILQLLGPNQAKLRSGCINGGTGYLDTTVLPTAGRYSIALNLGPTGTGQVRLRLSTVVDPIGPIVPGGEPATLVVGQPGASPRLTFTGQAGQKVFTEVVSTDMDDACGSLTLRRPGDDASIKPGCLGRGSGLIDTMELPTAGQYSIVLDPAGVITGQAQIRLTSVTDQTGTIAVDGPTVSASVGQIGAISAFSFAGTAGQKVTIEVVSATLPDECGWINLQRPGDNAVIGFGCVGNGKGTTPVLTLPATGTYRVVVDPPGTQTGDAVLKLHSAV
jgi:hypothetical protein